ncbi:hypothetical protein GCM10018779_32280 [Streptomyces griseocarneus]|nr:hypothetical protein GCM10018779_32280 [Streptomyces griseocarneus]
MPAAVGFATPAGRAWLARPPAAPPGGRRAHHGTGSAPVWQGKCPAGAPADRPRARQLAEWVLDSLFSEPGSRRRPGRDGSADTVLETSHPAYALASRTGAMQTLSQIGDTAVTRRAPFG